MLRLDGKSQCQRVVIAYHFKVSEVPLNDLSRWRDGEIDALLEAFELVLKSGSFMHGRQTRELENEIARISGQQSAVAVANGTDALYLALQALDVDEDWTVFNVANAGGYTTHAALRCGASVRFVDVDIATAQMSLESLRSALCNAQGSTVVVVTHLYGLMADIEAIAALCQELGSFLVEDCAQATGASRNGRAAGSFGDVATFSFYPTKNLAALGDGGAVALSSPDRTKKIRELAQYGWSERYKITRIGGTNSRIDELQSAVLLSRVRDLASDNEIRREIVGEYANSVSANRHFVWMNDESYVGHLAVMRSDHRKSDIERFREHGVQCGVHYPIPDHRQPAWARYFSNLELPNTDLLTKQIVTLPCFPRMTIEERERTCSVLATLR
jgi:dTDP-4-amino-4,6-dideoxygalactose transaminase